MSSNYDALAGGVNAFGGLGRDFGRLGGSFGRLGGASIPALYQWALNFYYRENSQYLVLGMI